MTLPRDPDTGFRPGGRIVRRAGLLCRGLAGEAAVLARIWIAWGEGRRPFLAPLLLVLSICLAWVAQAAIHVLVGGTPPGGGSYSLIPGLGSWITGGASWPAALYIYALAAVLLLMGVLLLPAGERIIPGGINHLEGEPASPLRGPSPGRGRPVHLWAVGAGALALLFIHAIILSTARVDLYWGGYVPPDRLGRFLAGLSAIPGLGSRPSWKVAYGLHLIQLPLLILLVLAWARWRGLPWKTARMAHLEPPTRRLWEWPVVGMVAVAFLLASLHRVEDVPYIIQQDDGIGGRFSLELSRPGSFMNVFGHDWIPNPAVIPRAITVELFGNSNNVLRYTSCLVGAFAMLAAFFCYRALFGVATSLALLLLTALSFHTGHFARVGTMHIDGLLVMFLTLGVFLRAELAAPGPRRMALYGVSGALVGIAYNLYPASRLSAIAVGGMLVVRLLAQRDLWRHRLPDILFLLFCMALFLHPFHVYNGPRVDRAAEVRLLTQPHLQNEFLLLEEIGQPVESVGGLIAHHMKSALGVFHYQRDNSHNLSSPFPAASPLVAALSLLGGILLLVRFRSWLALLCLGTFAAACFFGGAILFGPHAPSSSRMITLVPILMIAAGLPLSLLFSALRGAGEALAFRGRRAHLAAIALLAATGLWVLAQEAAMNRALYLRILTDPFLQYNAWMSHSTELQRFTEARVPAPDVVHHFDVDEVANQTYYHNDFLLPHTVGRRFWIPPGVDFNPLDARYPGTNWFIFHWARVGELEAVREAFPGGRLLTPAPVAIHGYPSRYVVYEYFNASAPGPVQPVWPWW